MNKEDEEKASSHSTVVVPKDIQLTLAEIRERRAAIDNLPEPSRRRCTSSCSDSSYDSDRHTHTEGCRFGERARIKANFTANAPTDIDTLLSIIDSLQVERVDVRNAAELAKRGLCMISGYNHRIGVNPECPGCQAWQRQGIVDGSRMKAELIKRVREKADDCLETARDNLAHEFWHDRANTLNEIADELEAVELTQESPFREADGSESSSPKPIAGFCSH